MTDTSEKKERFIEIVVVNNGDNYQASLDELERLLDTAGVYIEACVK